MKSIRRLGLSAAGIAAISTAVTFAAPFAGADTVGQGDGLEFVTSTTDCPPGPTPTPTPSTTGSSTTGITTVINGLLKGLGASGSATSGGTGASVG